MNNLPETLEEITYWALSTDLSGHTTWFHAVVIKNNLQEQAPTIARDLQRWCDRVERAWPDLVSMRTVKLTLSTPVSFELRCVADVPVYVI
ncbi:MAG: hypothetical protein CMF61_07875 [Magnetococcales bacterium]|nr:hypothetical protein [Magnetococcales bacterium]